MEAEAAQYLGVYDIELIYSWTPRQFKNFIKGAKLHEIDQIEKAAMSAMFNARAANGKTSVKKLFDAEKARKQIDSVEGEPIVVEKHLGRYNKAKEAMKNYRPQKGKKGG